MEKYQRVTKLQICNRWNTSPSMLTVRMENPLGSQQLPSPIARRSPTNASISYSLRHATALTRWGVMLQTDTYSMKETGPIQVQVADNFIIFQIIVRCSSGGDILDVDIAPVNAEATKSICGT